MRHQWRNSWKRVSGRKLGSQAAPCYCLCSTYHEMIWLWGGKRPAISCRDTLQVKGLFFFSKFSDVNKDCPTGIWIPGHGGKQVKGSNQDVLVAKAGHWSRPVSGPGWHCSCWEVGDYGEGHALNRSNFRNVGENAPWSGSLVCFDILGKCSVRNVVLG